MERRVFEFSVISETLYCELPRFSLVEEEITKCLLLDPDLIDDNIIVRREENST